MNTSLKSLLLAAVAAGALGSQASADQSYGATSAVMMTRQVSDDTVLSAGTRQLAANAGLSEDEARGLSLRQIAAHFFNRSASGDDRQRTDVR